MPPGFQLCFIVLLSPNGPSLKGTYGSHIRHIGLENPSPEDQQIYPSLHLYVTRGDYQVLALAGILRTKPRIKIMSQ